MTPLHLALRRPLPARRQSRIAAVKWQGIEVNVAVGMYPDGSPAEVFATTPKTGTMQVTLADTSVLISIALQHGITPADLAKSLAREPDPVATANEALRRADCEAAGEPYEPRDTSAPASPVGAIMAVVLDADKLAGMLE